MLEIINRVNDINVNKINAVLLTDVTKINTVGVRHYTSLPIESVTDMKMSLNGNFIITTGPTLKVYVYDKANKDLAEISNPSSARTCGISDKYTSDTSIYGSSDPYMFLRANSGGYTSGFGQPAYRRHLLYWWDPTTEDTTEYETDYFGGDPGSMSMSDDGTKLSFTWGRQWYRSWLIKDGAPIERWGSMGWYSSWTGTSEVQDAMHKVINTGFLSWSRRSTATANTGIWFVREPAAIAGFDSSPQAGGWTQIRGSQSYIWADISRNGKYVAAIQCNDDWSNKDRIDFATNFSQDFDDEEADIFGSTYFENPLFFRKVYVSNSGYAYLYDCADDDYKDVLRRINLNDPDEAPVDVFKTPGGGRLKFYVSNRTDALFFEEGSYVYYSGNIIV